MTMRPKTLTLALLVLVLGTAWWLGPYGLGIWGIAEPPAIEEAQGPSAVDAGLGEGGRTGTGTGEARIDEDRIAVGSKRPCRLIGHVFDELSRPIPGATLRLHALRNSKGGIGGGPIVARRTSRGDGSFEIRGLEWGRYLLEVHAEGFAEKWAKIGFVAPLGDVAEASVRLMGGYRLQGTVVDSSGKAVPGAWVEAVWWDGPAGPQTVREVRSDAGGNFRFPALPAGEYPLLVWSESHAMGLLRIDASRSGRVRVTLARRERYGFIFGLEEPPEPTSHRPADVVAELRLLVSGQEVLLPSPVRRIGVPPKGTVEVAGLRDGWYKCVFRSEQGVLDTLSLCSELTPAQPQATHLVPWSPGLGIEGRLVDESGKAVPGVRLIAYCDAAEDRPSTVTDEHGHWVFPPRFPRSAPVMLALESNSLTFQDRENQFRNVALEPGSKDNVLTVISPPALMGRVIDGQGRPVPGASVCLHTTIHAAGGLDLPQWTETNATGVFAFGCDPLDVGPRYLSASRDTRWTPEPLLVPGEGRVAQNDLILELGEGGAIEGQVVDDKGLGIPAVRLAAVHASTDSEGEFAWDQLVDGSVRSNGKGLFRILGLPPARWRIRAEREGLVMQGITPAVDLGAGQVQKGLRIVMTRGLSISGRLEGQDGAPLPGIKVRARFTGRLPLDEPGVSCTERSRADGSYEFRGLRAGWYDLTAEVDSAALARLGRDHRESEDNAKIWYSETHEKRVRSGTRGGTWKITLPRFGGFTAHLPTSEKRLESLEVQLESKHGVQAHLLSVKGGCVALTGLLVGTYDIRFSSSDFEDLPIKLQIRPDQDTELGLLPLIPARRVRCRIIDEDGRAVAGAWIGLDPALDGLWNTCDIEAGTAQFDGKVLAISDREGRFSLRLKQGAAIYVFRRGYVPAVQTIRSASPGKKGGRAGAAAQAGSDDQEVLVTLAKAGEIRIRPVTSSQELKDEYWHFQLVRKRSTVTGKGGKRADRWERRLFLEWNHSGRLLGLQPGTYRLFGILADKVGSFRKETVPGESYYEEIRIEAGSDRMIRVR